MPTGATNEDGRWVVRAPIVITPRASDPTPEAGGLYVTSAGVIKTSNGTVWAEPATAAIAAEAVARDAAIAAARNVAAARTATAAPGGTTGVIADGTSFVTVTTDDANKVITLPTPTPGVTVALINGATAYELRSSDPATVGINGGTGANAESAIGANVLVTCICATATAWVCTNRSTAGTVSATEVAAP